MSYVSLELLLVEGQRVVSEFVAGGEGVEEDGLRGGTVDSSQFLFVAQVADMIEVLMNWFGLATHIQIYYFLLR